MSGVTIAEIDARINRVRAELARANDAQDWERFQRADDELARLYAARAESIAKTRRHCAVMTRIADARQRALTEQIADARAAVEAAAKTTEKQQCRLF